jgi:sugar/nucleoside kinase (ribokinase family)
MQKTNDVIGLGNAMMDLLVEVNDDKISELGLTKGEFTPLANKEDAYKLLQQLQEQNQVKILSGGSVANTIKAIAKLGGNTLFCGKVGEDEFGSQYIQELTNYGVNSRINKCGLSTGHVISLITSDAERTFIGHLGATTYFSKEDILEEDITNSKVLHLEGYQLESPAREAVLYAINVAKKNNTKISIDFSDPGVIRRNKEFFKELVKDYVDIIFLNEEEAKEITGLEEQEALEEIAQHVEIAIVKLGAKGSLIYHNNETIKIDPYQANAIDTTGAGDTFAAGFLYGYCQGWEMKKSGKLGSLFSAKIVEHLGANYNKVNVDEIMSVINP